VHTDEKAAESVRAVSANAYTAGSHIAFGSGRYTPTGGSGRQLVAHELTHVVQQAEGQVDGTPIGEGFSVSQPGDSFERRAAEHQRRSGSELRDVGATRTSEVPGEISQAHRPAHIQRDTFGLSTGQADTSAGANQAAALNAWSAFGSAIAGLGSMTAAIIGLKFARRQAEAAEDPPVAEPTTGGVSSTHVELPEVKGVDLENLKEHKESTTEEEVTDTISGLKGSTEIPQEEKTSLTKELRTRKVTTKTTTKPAEKADQETSFTVLRLQQGTENSADFILTLRYNGTDVRGGATEDGEINGYLGGSAESNAAVTFRASPGAPSVPAAGSATSAGGAATVRVLFGGTNVPPRKEHSGSLGLFGGSAKKEDYHVQRFSATAKFSGKGEFLGFDTLYATPRDRSVVRNGRGSPESPLVTIGLSESTLKPGQLPLFVSPPSKRAAAGDAGAPSGGNSGGSGGTAPGVGGK
jgi:Domain of unknown function (DUF4157)